MLALAAIDELLFEHGIDGGPVAWLHDEIILEVPTEHAVKAAELLVKAMRDALDEAMTRVPTEYATVETKAYLAEYILKAAAQGRTTYQELIAAASYEAARRDAEISRRSRF